MHNILFDDFEYILSAYNWDKLKNSTILITGGTGFLGSLIIKTLDYASKRNNLNIHIIAFVRSMEKAKQILKSCNLSVVVGDIREPLTVDENIDYIFHTAAITKSKEMLEAPVEVIEGIVNGTQNVLKLANTKKIKSMVFLSSMEVYGLTDPSLTSVKEENLGFIDISNKRSSYPLGKRMAENICVSYHEEYQVPVKIARLAQTFGAGVLKNESRIFYQFAQSVINKSDIVLHTEGLSEGNYCYSIDAILALLMLLTMGINGEIYNVSNEKTHMTVRQMAELVAEKVAGGGISIVYDIPERNIYGYAAASNMKLSSEKMHSLGWQPKYDLENAYKRMVAYMLEEQ